MKNNKGFTLIELLATLMIISIVATITIYISVDVIANSKAKTYQTTINNIEKAASNYLLENNDKISYKIFDKKEYQCITISNLIESGYFDSDITNSKISDSEKVSNDDYIYIEKDSSSKVNTATYVSNTQDGYKNLCENKSSGSIWFLVQPDDNTWSKSKKVTINYKSYDTRIKTSNNYLIVNTKINETKTNVNNSETIEITEKSEITATIKDSEGTIIESSKKITKIDNTNPTIELKEKSTTTNYIKAEVTIPITITDTESGPKESINKENIEIIVGTTTISNENIEITKVSNNEYNITINNSKYSGKIKLQFKTNFITDNAENSNKETTLEPNIIFDNKKPTKPVYTAYYKSDTNKTYTSGDIALDTIVTTIESSDTLSGIKEIKYSEDQKNWTVFTFSEKALTKNGTKWSGSESWDFNVGRNQTYYFRACDNVGNCSESSEAFNIVYVSNYNINYKDVGNKTFSGTHETGYPTSYTYGTTTSLKGASKENYLFAGWFTDSEGTTRITDISDTTTEDITLFAGWTNDVTLSESTYTYNGNNRTPTVTVKYGSTTLTKDTDYTVSYTNNKNVGTASVIITGKGNYTGTITKTFTITKANDTVTLSAKTASYTGSPISANIATATSGTTITYRYYQTTDCSGTATTEPTNVGNYSVKATSAGNSNYNSGSICVTHTITNSTTATTGSCNQLTYTGSSQTLASNGSHVTYTNNSKTAAGSYTVTVKADTNYAFSDGSTSKTLSCSIAKAEATPGSCNQLTYTGSSQTLASNGSHVTYSNNTGTNAGSYTVTVNASTNYAFSDGTTSKTLSCSIAKIPATVSTAPTAKNLIYTGSAQTLANAGSCTGGTIKYASSQTGTYSTTIPTRTNANTYSVWYYCAGDTNHSDSTKTSISVRISRMYIRLNANGGSISGGNGNYSVNSSTGIISNSAITSRNTTYINVFPLSTDGFTNPHNSSYLRLKKVGYTIVKDKEWCTDTNYTTCFDDDYQYTDYSSFISHCSYDTNNNCIVTLYAHWVEDTVTFTFKRLNPTSYYSVQYGVSLSDKNDSLIAAVGKMHPVSDGATLTYIKAGNNATNKTDKNSNYRSAFIEIRNNTTIYTANNYTSLASSSAARVNKCGYQNGYYSTDYSVYNLSTNGATSYTCGSTYDYPYFAVCVYTTYENYKCSYIYIPNYTINGSSSSYSK